MLNVSAIMKDATVKLVNYENSIFYIRYNAWTHPFIWLC